MTDFPYTFQLSTAINPWILSILAIVSLLFAIWSYRRTIPPVPNPLRFALIALRWGALLGGLWLFAQPVLEIQSKQSIKPNLAILFDRSASMSLNQGGIDRIEQVNGIVKSKSFDALIERFNLGLFVFSDSLHPIDNLRDITNTKPDGRLTDLSTAIAGCIELSSPSAIVIITDGVSNSGTDPVRLVRNIRIPISSIGIGSSTASPDAMILKTTVSPVVYQGSRIPVTIGYRLVVLAGQSARLTLTDSNGEIIGQTTVKALSDFDEGEISFEYEVKLGGRQRLTATISSPDNDLTFDNNRRSFYLNALNNRMRALVMAGPPDIGLGDLIRRLKTDEHIQITTRTTRGETFYEGGWPDEKLLSETDLVILHHFPVRETNQQSLERFLTDLSKLNISLCLVDGGRNTPRMLLPIMDRLPVNLDSDKLQLSTGQMTPVIRHAIIAEPDELDYTAKWTNLPPIQFASGRYKSKPGSETLAVFRTSTTQKEPAIVISEFGGTKSAVLLAHDFWRWGLAAPGKTGVVEPLLGRLIRWLALRKSDKKVIIQFDKDQFNGREEVSFTTSVFNENFLPVDGAVVEAEVEIDRQINEKFLLKNIGNGLYAGSFTSGKEGEYRVKVKAVDNNREIGSDSGNIIVEPFSVEFLETRLNDNLLRSIAEITGGSYVKAEHADSMLTKLEYPYEIEETTAHYVLWGIWQLLLIIIILLSVEWFIRIRTGML